MQSQRKASIVEKGDGTSATLDVEYSIHNSSITWGMNMMIHESIKEFGIDPEKIASINLTKNNCIRKLQIEYSK